MNTDPLRLVLWLIALGALVIIADRVLAQVRQQIQQAT